MAIKLDLLEVENIYNKDGEQTLNLTGDQGIVVSGNVTLSSTAPILYLANTTSSTGKTWRFSSAANGNAYIAQDGVIDAITLSHTTGNATFAGSITMPEALKATNNNLKFYAGGTHVFNVDVNKNIYPQTHNSTDLGFSSTLAFRQLWLSGDINTSGELIINNNASNNDKGIHIKNDTDAYGGGITFWTEYGGTDTNVARVQGGTNGSNGILYLQTANTSKVLTTALSLDFNQNAFFANDVTFKNASIVKLKAAPLGSLYGAGFNVMTVTGTSSAPYTSTIGFSNYSATDVLKLEGTNATFAGTIDSGTITSTGIVKAATTFQSTAGSMTFYVPNVGQALEIAQNTGDVNVGGFSDSGTTALNLRAGGEHDTKLGLFESSENYGFSLNYDGGDNRLYLKRHDNSAGGTAVLTFQRYNDSAYFAGDVILPALKKLHLYLLILKHL